MLFLKYPQRQLGDSFKYSLIHPVYREASLLCDLQPLRAQFATDSRVENRAPVAGRKHQVIVKIEGGVSSFQ